MQRQADAVVGYTALRIVVRPNPLAAVARADFALAFAGILRFFLLTKHIRNTSTQYLQGLRFIFILRFAVLACAIMPVGT